MPRIGALGSALCAAGCANLAQREPPLSSRLWEGRLLVRPLPCVLRVQGFLQICGVPTLPVAFAARPLLCVRRFEAALAGLGAPPLESLQGHGVALLAAAAALLVPPLTRFGWGCEMRSGWDAVRPAAAALPVPPLTRFGWGCEMWLPWLGRARGLGAESGWGYTRERHWGEGWG